MEMKSLQMGTDWTYLFNSKAILGRETTIVDIETLRDDEVVIIQMMHGRRCRRDRRLGCSRPRPRRRHRQGGSGLLRGRRHHRHFLLTSLDVGVKRSHELHATWRWGEWRGDEVHIGRFPAFSFTGGLRELSLVPSVGRGIREQPVDPWQKMQRYLKVAQGGQ